MNGGVGGSYNEWAYYSPSSSNLSAFAQPFSVNRFTSNDVSAPFVDLAESSDAIPPNHFPVPSRSYGYDFFSNPVRQLDPSPSSKPYGLSGLQLVDSPNTQLPSFNSLGLASKDKFAYDQCSSSIKSSLDEVQPYYPSCISSPIHDRSSSVAHNNWSSSSSFVTLDVSRLSDHAKKLSEIVSGQGPGWNQFAEFNQVKSKHVEVGSSSYSKEATINGSIVEENLMNQGCQNVKGSNNGELLHSSNMMGWEKQGVPMSANQFDDNSRWWQTSNSMPVDFSSTAVLLSPSVESHCEAPMMPVTDLGNRQLPYTSSYDKHLWQHDKTSWIDTGSSASVTGLVKDLITDGHTADGDLGGNNFSNMKEAYTLPSTGRSSCFDLSQLRMHLERNETNNASDKIASMDVMDYAFKVRHGIQNPHLSPDSLSLRLSTDEISVEKPFDSVDRCNPAVDSPCWKGTPAAKFYPFEASDAPCSEYVKKTEGCFDFLQGTQNIILDTENNVKISCENLNNIRTGYQEKGLAGSPRSFLLSSFTSDECNFGAMNVGTYQFKTSGDYGDQYLDEISELRESSMSPKTTMHDCESQSSNTEQEVVEQNKFMSQRQHADTGCGVNECLEYGTSHAAEHGLSSPSSVENAPSKLEKSDGKVSMPKINVQMLVDTMHNLSELLLSHCLNDACELKEHDHNVLKDIISNLNACALKNAEQMIPGQECLLPKPDTSKCVGVSCELKQNTNFEGPNLTKVGPESYSVECEKLPIHFVSCKQHGKISDSFPTRGAEIIKEDNMTKALTRLLSENFRDEEGAEPQTLLYKNLWLEAEAALCSANFRARYLQMKIEMEKYSFRQRDDALDMDNGPKPVIFPNLSSSQSSTTKMKNGPNPDYSGQDLPVLNAEQFCFKFFPDLNKPNTLASEEKVSVSADSAFLGSAVSGTNTEAKSNEASVLGRFHVLKSQLDNSHVDTANSKGLLCLEALHAFHTANKLVSEGTDSQIQVDSLQDSPIPVKNKAYDFDAAVMARFHILKSLSVDSSSMCSEGQLLDGIGFVGIGSDSPVTKNVKEGESLDVNTNPVLMHVSSSTAIDKSTPKEFHLNLEDEQEILPRGTYESSDQPPTNYLDGFSSEWERIEKEELVGQTLDS